MGLTNTVQPYGCTAMDCQGNVSNQQFKSDKVTVSWVAGHSTAEHAQSYCVLHTVQGQQVQFLSDPSCIKYRKSHQVYEGWQVCRKKS